MRKVIVFNMITLDGFIAGPNGDIDWHQTDDEFNTYSVDQLEEVGCLLFGRVTYELMAGFWPTPVGIEDEPIVAESMNRLPKVVFSTTLDRADWQNTRLVKGNVAEEVSNLKRQEGKNLFVFGSAVLCSTLIRGDLIDEYRLMLTPIAIGRGQPFFKDIEQAVKLRLNKSRGFKNGNLLLNYQPVR